MQNLQKLMVQSQAQFESYLPKLAEAEWLALDTEFIRRKTYYPEIALVQIAWADGAICLDPYKLDLRALASLLANPDVLKLVHAGSQDLELLTQYCTESEIVNVMDTQFAAAFAGFGSMIGYGNLVEQALGVKLSKQYSQFDWTKRPLPTAVLEYALDDVRYLYPVWEILHERLQAKNRLEWAIEDSARMAEKVQRSTLEPESALNWVKNAHLVRNPDNLPKLAALSLWREQTAITKNLPRQWIVPDDALIAVANEGLFGLPSANLTWLKAIEKCLSAFAGIPAEAQPIFHLQGVPSKQERERFKMLQMRAQEYAEQLDVPVAALINSKQLHKIAQGKRTDLPFVGWRAPLVGKHLAEIAESLPDFAWIK